MGRMQRAKGARWEREVAKKLRAIFPEAERTGWKQVEDIVPDVSAGPFHVECKVGARPNPIAALAQSMACAPAGKIAVAICKKDREWATVTMDLEDWLDLVREWAERRNPTIALADEVLGGGS
jgi:hypothetical protein